MTDETAPAVVEAEPGLLNPITGELVAPDDVAAIGQALEALREHENKVRDAISAFTRAAVAYSLVAGTKTLVADGVKIEISPDTGLEWDVEELDKLLDAGLPRERYRDLVKEVVTRKVDARVARQIAGANPAYKAIIDRAQRRVPKRQYASVKTL